MKKELKIFLSLAPLIFIGYLIIYTGLASEKIYPLIIISLLIMVSLYFDDIRKVSFGKDGLALEKRELEALKEEAQVTIDKLNETIEPLLKFNLALINKDGKFDNVTDFDALADFIYALDDLSEGSFRNNPQLIELFNLSLHNIVYSFTYKADDVLGKNFQTRPFVQFGGSTKGENPLDIPIIVRMEKLRALSNELEYQALLDRFEKFASIYLPNSIVDERSLGFEE